MRKIDWTWIIPALVFCMILAIGAVVALEALDTDEPSTLKPYIDFCWDQLQSEVDDCIDWAFAFRDMYGDAAAECLDNFESDSALLLMCMSNIVNE